MSKNFEMNLDFNGARNKADQMAKEFTRLTGIGLKFDHFYIDSPYYGYIDKLEDYPEDDPDSWFVFTFDEVDNHYEDVSFIPTLNKVMVWRSLNDDNPYWDADDEEDYGAEGAVDPITGFADWEDELEDAAYPLSAWKHYRRPKV
jgi:hypothetical protein